MKNIILPFTFASLFFFCGCVKKSESSTPEKSESKSLMKKEAANEAATIDTVAYNKKLLAITNGDSTGRWPVKPQPYPQKGAILPFNRIVAYYGNLFSKRMGVLGEYPPKELWQKLHAEMKAWEKADPTTPVIPAIHYIAVVAQGSPGKDGMYRYRMPDKQIDSALTIAKMGNAIVFLDVQVSLSNLKAEVPLLEKYLKMPNVHLGIDPEFSMKEGHRPGTKIGWFDAEDVNFCSNYLAKLVRDNHLSPKILIVHRFTQGMIKNYRNIKLHPEVQIVMNMDGWMLFLASPRFSSFSSWSALILP